MPVLHVFEKIKELKDLKPRGKEVVLEDGTTFSLPPIAYPQCYKLMSVGDKVLLDFSEYEKTKSSWLYVYREGRQLLSCGLGELIPLKSPVLAKLEPVRYDQDDFTSH